MGTTLKTDWILGMANVGRGVKILFRISTVCSADMLMLNAA